MTQDIEWLLAIVQVPSQPSRHRVALWRQLRKTGAVPVAAGTWAVPNLPPFTTGLQRARELCLKARGTFASFVAAPEDPDSRQLLYESFRDARLDEWSEFAADAVKFEDEINKEISKKKFTFAELEEEEQSLERLRRWYADLKKRDVLRLEEASAAHQKLKRCTQILESYADMVYAALHPTGEASE